VGVWCWVKQAREEVGVGAGEGDDMQVVSWSDLLEPAYSGSAQAVGGGKAERVYAIQKNYWCIRIEAARTYSRGIPCLRKDRVLDLRGRGGDGSG